MADLQRTPLHEEHVRLNGKLVPFAGFEMPVQYPTGITAEHQAVREHAGLFDVSHMGEFFVRGPDALALVQRVAVNDASRLETGQAQYSAMCRPDGGILDDLIVYRLPAGADLGAPAGVATDPTDEHAFMLVVNAGNRAKDLAWILEHAAGLDVAGEARSDRVALLALQGPRAREILQGLSGDDVDAIGYYRFAPGRVAGVEALISATGYTGEDGFELYVGADDAPALWRRLLDEGGTRGLVPAGLGARDSLRLEMGYALYGNDLDEEHTPLEAGLGWITRLGKGEFVGRDALARQKEEGVTRRLVGLELVERGFPRPGYDVLEDERPVGTVTSGTVSPSLGEGIAMAYVPSRLAEPGTELAISVRGKAVPAAVRKPPFYTGGSIRR